MIPLKRILLAAAAALLSLPLAAQVPFTGSYSENFDSLGTAGTTKPAGWTVWNGPGTSNSLWTNATGIIGGLATNTSSIGAMTINNSALTASNTPTANANQGYNAGAPGDSANRLLGTAPTSIGGAALQLVLTNNTGADVGGIRVSYDIRRFTTPAANQLPGYWLFYSIDSGVSWTNVSALNPTISGPGGVIVPNSVGVTSVPQTTITFPSSVANGSEIRLRWVDDNAQESSPDQIIGLDNVSITLPVVNNAPTVALTAPTAGATYDAPASITLTADAADTDGTISKVEFFNGATKLGEAVTTPYQFVWNNAISGSYALTAVATDNLLGTATSAAVNITVTNTDNVAPTVTLTAPSNGATILTSSIALAADAADSDGAVSKVEFFDGSTKLGEDTTSPYTYNWTGVATGTYTLTAVVTDNDGTTTISAAANISVAVPITTTLVAKGATWKFLDNGTDQGAAWKETGFDDSAWPAGPAPLGYGDSHIVTTVYSPAAPNRYITTYFRRTFNVSGAAALQALNVNILRDDGVVVYINGTEVARQNMPTGAVDYLTWSSSIVGGTDETTYFPSSAAPMPTLIDGVNTIAVELHQRDGTSSDLGFDMELISLVLPGTPPTVTITAPANNATFTAPATISITADAADADGTVTKVEFFEGANKLGEDTVAPYTFEWTIVPQGTYTLTAKATDNFGQSTTSAAVNITVAPPNTLPPTVAITAPANNANLIAPATIAITANAADSDGTVSKVEFFNGATKLGEDTSEPYTYNWTNVPVGDYTLTAKATDNLTATTTTSAVVIHVLSNQPPTIAQTAPADLASVATPTANLEVAISDPENQALTVTFYGREKTATAGADFTLATLPDTQHYSSSDTLINLFKAQTQWIVAQRGALNIAFVSHMGDMTNNSTAAEYVRSNTAMSIIEDPVTTGLPSGIPWGGAPGNHDPSGWDTTYGPSRFAGRPYFQGNYPTGSAVNSYQFFSAGGMDFLHINLAMYPTTAALAWADGILKANPTRRAILTSHSILNVGGSQTSWTAEGTTIYGALKGNPNLFLMLCGHMHGIGRRTDVYNGNTIYSVLQDYQDEANGGDSWLRYFTFSPANNKIMAYVIRCNDGTRRTDAESQFEMTYNMQGSAPWTALGTVNVAAAGTSASLAWTGLTANTPYEWYATVTDGVTPVSSGTRSFTAEVPSPLPTVAITAPANGASFIVAETITLTATAADADGSVSKVEFFDGAVKLGEDSAAPYSFEWTNVPVGDHTLTAVATDNLGLAATSATVNITVTLPAVAIAATRAGAVEYGSGRTLEFTISRTGPTTQALVVPLVSGGSATQGTDYTGFVSSVTIPAGSASVTLTLTVLSDNLVDGTETVTIALGTSTDFTAGATASANATIADSPASGVPWSFGVMADTQLTGYPTGGTNGVSTDIIDAVNQQFIEKGVDFVIQVGDLCESGGASQLQTRLDHNAALTAAGIRFYGLRGNHEGDATSKAFFQSHFIPSAGGGLNVEVAPFDSASYAVTWKGCKFVLLDYPTSTSTGAMDNATAWTNTVFGEIDHSQAFTFHHKNLLGQNHKDNQFGSSNDANPAQQNAFLAMLQANGVRYDMSGHDHMNHRAIVTSPDGLSKVQQIICQSDSTKFYIASSGFSSREQSISDQQLKIGFYTYTVEGPKVTGRYFSAEKDTPDSNQNGTIIANPVWTLQDTFGYSLNGTQTTVPRGGSYAGIIDSTTKAVSNGETGYLGTAMGILAGTNTTTGTAEGNRAEVDDLNTGWAPKDGALVSDVLTLWGMNNALGSVQTDTFALSLSYDPAVTINAVLVTRVGGAWVNSVTGNTGGAVNFAGDRPFNAATDTLGSYGYDSGTHTAWAVINHNSDFAVASAIAPTVAISTPLDGASFIVAETITLTATAADADGSVSKVEFFDGVNKLGEDTAAPYSFDWTSAPAGDHTLTAKVTDNLGITAVSSAVVIHVVANQPPTVAITSPADGASSIAPATLTLTATATDADGSVSKVEFFAGSNKLGEASTAPYAYDWSNIPVGSHVLTAVATDNLGVTATSAAVTITVNLPTVTIAATHASAGESGADRTLEFTITRSGPTTNSLTVPLVAGGSATEGTDYSGFVSSVTIPAGSAAVAQTLTVLPDSAVEGTETVTIALGTSADFTAGTPASADATIADGPVLPRYVAGDWHQHTTYTDGSYSIGYQMARNNQYGLDWWANSEHGGAFNRCGRLSGTGADPLNATVTWASMGITGLGNNLTAGNMWRWQSIRDYSFADVLTARTDYPSKVIIQGYEWNVPGLKPTGAGGSGHEHCSMGSIAGEFDASPNANVVAQFEYQFDMSDGDTSSDNGMGWTKSGNPNTTDAKMVEAAAWLQANHPTTSWLTPAHPERKKNWTGATFRKLNDAAPSVAFGFESMPGHQRSVNRGEYGNGQNGSNNSNGGGSYGGCGYFSAKLGGLWDSLLGEGRHFWLFTSSDSHEVAANDFYPGEYQKTYSYASDPGSPQAIVDGLRSGNSFVVQGDLIDSLDFKVDGAVMGSTLLATSHTVTVTITVHDPEGANNGPDGFNSPTLDHLDLIAGEFGGLIPASDPAYSSESNPSTAVIARFDATGGVTDANGITSIAWNDLGGGTKQMSIPVNTLGKKLYFRLRGSNVGLNVPGETDGAGNPLVDAQGQNTVQKAYSDLWFYSNPVFVESRYFAGDFHQHTTYSDGSNPFATVMAKNHEFGLDWWANSEHGGKFNRNAAGPILTSGFDTAGYAQFWDALGTTILGDSPGSSGGHANMWRWQSLRDFSFNDVLTARGLYPDKTIVQGVEWNVPGHEHCSVGMIADEFGPNANADAVSMFEYLWDANDADTSRGAKTTTNNHAKAVAAVQWMQANHPTTSWMVPAHPERRGVQAYPPTYTGSGSQGYSVAAFRDLNNAGPDVCFGFESMPGHQKDAGRGGYGTGASGGGTSGGCGTYAARVGGLWDAMLGEGRHFWLFASSDFHNTGGDFWPGEYQKTYTAATNNDAQSIVNGLRSGNSFVVEGDLIDALDFTVGSTDMGGTLASASNMVTVSIRVHDPVGTNHGPAGLNTPALDHLDVIAGQYGSPIAPTDPAYTNDMNLTTRVIARFAATSGPADSTGLVSHAWTDLGDGWKQMTLSFDTQWQKTYFRLRGSNLGLNVVGQTDGAGNPLVDPQANTANDAWADLWFYSNPVFVAPVISYTAWAAANASGQDADQDTNHTGVPNGIRYFMGATGSSPVANPGIVNGAVTWPKSPLFLGTYVIEVSSDLATWEPATTNYASYITDNGTSVVFTLPPVPGKIFTRLRVVPAP